MKEQTQQFIDSLAPLLTKADTASVATRSVEVAARLLEEAASAVTTLDPKMIESLRADTRSSGSYVGELQQACMIESQKMEASPRLALLQSLGDLQMIVGLLHRLSKLLTDPALHRSRPRANEVNAGSQSVDLANS